MKKRNTKIDLLKFIFSVIIVLYHGRHVTNNGDEVNIICGGYLAVDFFFLVSGYYFALSAKNRSANTVQIETCGIGTETIAFMKKKICILLPNYLVAWVIAFFVKNAFDSKFPPDALVDKFDCIWEALFLREFGIGSSYFVNGATWYISAMLIVMFVLYPLIIKNIDVFLKIFAPIASLFLLGTMFQTFTSLSGPSYWFGGFVFKGMMRAMCEILLGCVIFVVADCFRVIRFKKQIRIALAFVEPVLYTGMIYCIIDYTASKMDFVWLMLIFICLLLTFSEIPVTAKCMSEGIIYKICVWLGEFSLSLFLGHGFWSQVINYIPGVCTMQYEGKLSTFIVLSFATGLFIMYFSKLLRTLWKQNKERIATIVLE